MNDEYLGWFIVYENEICTVQNAIDKLESPHVFDVKKTSEHMAKLSATENFNGYISEESVDYLIFSSKQALCVYNNWVINVTIEKELDTIEAAKNKIVELEKKRKFFI